VYAEDRVYVLTVPAFSFSGDSFTVFDAASGATAFSMSRKRMAVNEKNKLSDASGAALYTLTGKLCSSRARMAVTDARTDQIVLNLRKKSLSVDCIG
jgi:uncharacterized protein YxjI